MSTSAPRGARKPNEVPAGHAARPRHGASPVELTILILCRDEEGSIVRCVRDARGFLERARISGEVLVVDNGSRDASAASAKKAGAIVVVEPNSGYGNAIRAGIEASRGRYIILGDGDGEHDLGTLDPFWKELLDGNDFVFGSRSFSGTRSLLRRMGASTLSGIGRLFIRSRIDDFHCGLRAFSASAVRSLELRSPGMELASEMIVKAVYNRMRITVIPVVQHLPLDPDRRSHLRILSDGWRHVHLLLMLTPRLLYLYPGCVLLTAGILAMIVPIASPVEEGGRFDSYTMLFGLAFTVCGVQLFLLLLMANVLCENIGLTAERTTAFLQNTAHLGIAAGLALVLLGSIGSIWSLFILAEAVDPIDVEVRMRIAIPSVMFIILGCQTVFSLFLLGLLSIHGPNSNDGRRGEFYAEAPPPCAAETTVRQE